MTNSGSFRPAYEIDVSNRSANPRPARLGRPATKLMVAALLILVLMVGVGLAINPSRQQFDWFLRLRRPAWLTFEGLIPLIWISIYACFYASALLCWNASWSWGLMGGYLGLLLLVQSYTWLICSTRSSAALSAEMSICTPDARTGSPSAPRNDTRPRDWIQTQCPSRWRRRKA